MNELILNMTTVTAPHRSPRADDRLVALAVARAKEGSRSELQVLDERGGEEPYASVPSSKHALGRLPHEQPEILILRPLIGLSPGEIARVLHKTRSAVHGLHHRARRSARALLRDFDAAPAA